MLKAQLTANCYDINRSNDRIINQTNQELQNSHSLMDEQCRSYKK